MTVIFKNWQGDERLIGTADTEEDCNKLIDDYLEQIGLEWHYKRFIYREDYINVDFGSHMEFFYIYLKD